MAGFSTYDLGDCCCPTCAPVSANIVDCATGLAIVGAVVNISGVGSCTTDATGRCSITIPATASYEYTVSKSGYVTFDIVEVIACGTPIGASNIGLEPVGSSSVFTVYGCCSKPLPGASFTIGGHTYTTDANGQVFWGVNLPGDYPWSETAPRFVGQSGTQHVATRCAAGVINLTPAEATGYGCAVGIDSAGGNYPWPVSNTITFTDSVYGTVTLTSPDNTASWTGSLTVTNPGYCGCASGAITITYTLNRVTGCTSSVLPLHIEWTALANCCPGNTSPCVISEAIGLSVAPGAPLSASGSITYSSCNKLWGTTTVNFTATGT